MASLRDSLVDVVSRKLPLRMRPDLAVVQQQYEYKPCWVIKDPLSLKYYRFQEHEYALLRMLDGEVSLTQMQDRFQEQFRPRRITFAELHEFLGRLHKAGLVQAQVSDQGEQLYRRRVEQRRAKLWGMLSNPLAIRFRGIDPDALLSWLHPRLAWMFSPWCVAFCLSLMVAAALLVTVQFDAFRARLPEFNAFFTVENAIWLSVTLAIAKILHEFGHGLSCKHFGGECHEMGAMLLVLTPCLYCNVSDSWILPSKWRRAAIGAAGMYVELTMASIATFVWWFSEPGLLNHLALNTMFICSVSTVFFNGNPLMKYDGYYILSDLIEIPNLRQKADQVLSRSMGAVCLGLKNPPDPFLPRQRQALFAAYALAAVVYKWVVTLSILWFLCKVFEPYGLKSLGQMLALVMVGSMLFAPAWRLWQFLSVPGRASGVKPNRAIATACVVAVLLAAFFGIPLPYHVYAPVVIERRDAQSVFVQVPGTLDEVLVRPGEQVAPGQPLARLVNLDLERELADLTGQRNQQQALVAALDIQRFDDPNAAAQLPTARESLAELESRRSQRQADLSRLVICAPVAGRVLTPPETPDTPPEGGMLTAWSGDPLAPRNRGATLDEGTLYCQVGDPRSLEAIIVVDQADVEWLREGQFVELCLHPLADRRLAGEIAELATVDLEVAPRHLASSAGGPLATTKDRAGGERLLSASYQARVPLTDASDLRPGLSGRAKVRVGWQTCAQLLGRYLAKTFRLDW